MRIKPLCKAFLLAAVVSGPGVVGAWHGVQINNKYENKHSSYEGALEIGNQAALEYVLIVQKGWDKGAALYDKFSQ